MATVSSEHIPEQPPTALTTQRKAAPWGYFFYCELLKIFRNPPAVVFGIGFPTFFFLLFGNIYSSAYGPTILASYAAYGAFVVAFRRSASRLPMNAPWAGINCCARRP